MINTISLSDQAPSLTGKDCAEFELLSDVGLFEAAGSSEALTLAVDKAATSSEGAALLRTATKTVDPIEAHNTFFPPVFR